MKKLILPLCFAATVTFAEETFLNFTSGPSQTALVELYTSEGCSSCPPAEQWLSRWVNHEDLFETVFPVAFHVDYWNWLGWKDPFSKAAFTERQATYVKQRRVSQAYTPGFVVNGDEWKGWFRGQQRWTTTPLVSGVASLSIAGDRAQLNFDASDKLTANLAVLGNGLTNAIKNGENRGKTLTHYFVVLEHQSQIGQQMWEFELPDLDQINTGERAAVVAWLTDAKGAVVQTVGGYLGQKAEEPVSQTPSVKPR